MNVRLRLAEIYLPGAVRRKKFAELVRLTARSFGTEPPSLPYARDKATRAYALFTREQALDCLAGGVEAGAIQERLFAGAFEFGSRLRRALGVSNPEEAMRAARLLYKGIDIDFRGRPDGDISIRTCAFSEIYSAGICALMSAVDEGVLAGLAGGGRLVFSGRLTEGRDRCLARFFFPGSRP